MTRIDEIIKILKRQFNEDNYRNNNNVDYLSWELGFKRGMEYQRGLNKRISLMDLNNSVEDLIKDFRKRSRDDDDDEGEVVIIT